MKKRYLMLVLLMAVFMLGTLSACGSKTENVPVVDDNSASAADGSGAGENDAAQSDAVNQIAADKLPAFDMEAPYEIDLSGLDITTLAGEAFTGENFAAYDLTMINIWATWCGPCVTELPELAKIYAAYESKGVNLVGLLLDDDLTAANQLLSDAKATYPCIVSEGDLLTSLEQTIQFVPTTIFVDSTGKIVGGYLISSRDFDSWSVIIDEMLAAMEQS